MIGSNDIFESDTRLALFSLYPFFAFYRGCIYLTIGAFNGGIKMDKLNDGVIQLGSVYGFLFVEGCILYILAWYLDQVSEHARIVVCWVATGLQETGVDGLCCADPALRVRLCPLAMA